VVTKNGEPVAENDKCFIKFSKLVLETDKCLIEFDKLIAEFGTCPVNLVTGY
jgi:hypothetical protein